MKEKPNFLYHYTSVESLAMILSTKTFRLSPLSVLDDLQEEKTEDVAKIGKTVFVSSWTDDNKESIPMWNMYSKMGSGVRIKAKTDLFESGIVLKDKIMKVSGYAHFDDNRHLFPPELKEVIYTDEDSKIIPRIVSDDKQCWSQQEFGVYKNKLWEFQNEWRYIVRIWPGNKFDKPELDIDTIYEKFSLIMDDFIYLNIKQEVFDGLEITLSPKISLANRVIIDALKSNYCPNLQIFESALKDCIR